MSPSEGKGMKCFFLEKKYGVITTDPYYKQDNLFPLIHLFPFWALL